jgi:hypothetical protein
VVAYPIGARVSVVVDATMSVPPWVGCVQVSAAPTIATRPQLLQVMLQRLVLQLVLNQPVPQGHNRSGAIKDTTACQQVAATSDSLPPQLLWKFGTRAAQVHLTPPQSVTHRSLLRLVLH